MALSTITAIRNRLICAKIIFWRVPLAITEGCSRNRLICPKIIFWRAPLAITEGYSTIVITLSGITEGCSRQFSKPACDATSHGQ